MENDDGRNVEMYIPRKCSATTRMITAMDPASVRINSVYQGEYTPVAFSGFIRFHAGVDHSLNRLAAEEGLMKELVSFPAQHKFKGEE